MCFTSTSIGDPSGRALPLAGQLTISIVVSGSKLSGEAQALGGWLVDPVSVAAGE
jgi:hypothetical protein